ncbi:MAG: hypothetical protein KDK60_04435 [Chlamydiia bacterium]|nr:hypothetical protein [Chlamydiia bacterium]
MGVITLGPKETFSHQAAQKLYPKKKMLFARSIDEVFFRLAEPEISEAVVPLENTLSFFVEETITNLMKYDFALLGKTILKIAYHLVGEGESITRLYAHPHAFKQCRQSVKAFCPSAKVIQTENNALSVVQWSANPKGAGAIVPQFACALYDLPILTEDFQDEEENYTTFYALGKSPPKKSKKNGSAFLIFSEPIATITNQISQFASEKKVPLLKLKNLVLQEGETPLYFIEVEGHIEDPPLRALFETLSDKFLIKHLGSYPL